MKVNIAEALGLNIQRVGIKATTSELLGFVGREEGIAAMAVARVELPSVPSASKLIADRARGESGAMAKAEISWKRLKRGQVQVYARHVGRDWRFFARERRYDRWQAVAEPPLADWLELLDAVQRLINRRRVRPKKRLG